MRALVTGAGGFLGRYIVQRLVERGDYVRSFSRKRYPILTSMGVESTLGDIRDLRAVSEACESMDAVFHVAAIAGIWGEWDDFYQINTVGTENVIAGCQQHAVGRLIYTSSPSVTFDGRDQCDIDESAPYPKQWLCHYPHTKALAERQVLRANDHSGLRTCALRPHLIWGPRDPHLIPRLLARAQAGQLRRVGDGSNLIDIVHVENAAEAHLQAAAALENGSAACGKAYFISQGKPVNCWQWIDQLLGLAGLPKVEKSISLKAAWCAGAVLETAHRFLRIKAEPRMTRFLAAQLGTSHYFDISHARNDLQYEPRISTDDGMRSLANSWLNG